MKTKEREQNSPSVGEGLLFIGGIKWGVFQLFEMLWMLFFYSPGTPIPHKTGGDPSIWRSDLTGLLLDLIGNALYLPISLPSESRWWKEARNKSPENYTAGVEELSCHRFSRQKTSLFVRAVDTRKPIQCKTNYLRINFNPGQEEAHG